jgi:hypothetical protein
MQYSENMRVVISQIADKFGLDLSQKRLGDADAILRDGDGKITHMRIENEPYMPLIVEIIGVNRVSVAHSYRQNGDTIYDPEIVYWVAPGNGEWYPISTYTPPMLIMGRVLGGRMEYVQLAADATRAIKYFPNRQHDAAEFSDMWARNIWDQQFIQAGIVAR